MRNLTEETEIMWPFDFETVESIFNNSQRNTCVVNLVQFVFPGCFVKAFYVLVNNHVAVKLNCIYFKLILFLSIIALKLTSLKKREYR